MTSSKSSPYSSDIFHTIPTGKNLPKEINIIVEIPEGSFVKYEYDKKYGVIMVDRFLHTPMPYPFSYGLIPQTWNDYDNDPLDAVILASQPLVSGCVTPCRVVGILSVDDCGERDDKVLCVPVGDPYSADIHDVSDIPSKKREDIEYFMTHYKDLEKNKVVTVQAWNNAQLAQDFIAECQECYAKKFA